MNGLILGLLSAFSFGTADFLAGKAGRKASVFTTLFYMQLVGLVYLTAVVTWQGQWHSLSSFTAVGMASFWMGLDLLGILFLYQGLAVGKSSVVAPIASSFSVLTVFLAFVFGGERLSATAIVAVGLTLIGVMLASMVFSGKRVGESGGKLESGAVWALLAALFLGAAFFGFRYPQEAIGGLVTVWIGRMQAAIALPVVYMWFRKCMALPDLRSAGMIAGVGVLDATALVCYNFGLGLDDTSIVITATSLFAVVTLLWGVLLNGERLTWNQWAGICSTFVGIIAISLQI